MRHTSSHTGFIRTAAVTVLAAAASWLLRGIYDEITLDEGVFHVVNATTASRRIELAFPSGERRSATLAAGQAADVHVSDTGEGAVAVTADDLPPRSVGYVTSHNSLTVVVVQRDSVLFSQRDRR